MESFCRAQSEDDGIFFSQLGLNLVRTRRIIFCQPIILKSDAFCRSEGGEANMTYRNRGTLSEKLRLSQADRVHPQCSIPNRRTQEFSKWNYIYRLDWVCFGIPQIPAFVRARIISSSGISYRPAYARSLFTLAFRVRLRKAVGKIDSGRNVCTIGRSFIDLQPFLGIGNKSHAVIADIITSILREAWSGKERPEGNHQDGEETSSPT